MEVGEIVTIEVGAFNGIKGTVVKVSRRRVRVSVDCLERPIEIELERQWVAAATPERRAMSRAVGLDGRKRKSN